MKMNIKERRLKLWKMRQEEEGYDVSEVNTLEDAEHFFDKQPKVKKEKKQPKAEQPKVKKEETSEGDKIENQEENPDDSQKENETENQVHDENSDASNTDDVEDITVSAPTLESPLE